MNYINDVNINEAVINVLESNSDRPILNEFKIDLNDDTYIFLYKHIEKCLNDDELKYAKFNGERNIVKEIVKDNESNLIEISKQITEHLFYIMKSNCNIASSDLIIASIITDQGPMIAILKMEYVKSFIHEIECVENKVEIGIVAQEIGLPGSGQKIQKAAFIKPCDDENLFDLMILDKKRTTKEEEEYGINYWINNFIDCSIVRNERDQTKSFIDGTEYWVRKNYSYEADKAQKLRKNMRDSLLKDESINISEFANENLKDPGASDNFKVFMSGRCEEEIIVDKVYVEKKLNKVKLKIDKDINLSISKEFYEDKSKFEVVKNGDGSINLVIKNVINYIEK